MLFLGEWYSFFVYGVKLKYRFLYYENLEVMGKEKNDFWDIDMCYFEKICDFIYIKERFV